MRLTRRDWLKSLAVTPFVGAAVAALPRLPAALEWIEGAKRSGLYAPEECWSARQKAAIDSESPLILLTGGRGSGKSWVLRRIAEKEQRRFRQIGLVPAGYGNQEWSDLDLEPDGPAIQMAALDGWIGVRSGDVLVVDNAEYLSDRDFGSLERAARLIRHGFPPFRIIVASMPSDRNRDALLDSGLFEVHHLGATWANPYIWSVFSPEQRVMLLDIDAGKLGRGA